MKENISTMVSGEGIVAATTATTQNLEEYLSSVRKLDLQVEKQLIEIVKANGNLIRTDQTEHKDTILGFIFDEEIDRYIDKKVLAITVIGNQLCVLLGELDAELDEDITDEELLAISDDWDWEPITAGMMLVSDTFVNICERINQYV
jgi:hypothetical protein